MLLLNRRSFIHGLLSGAATCALCRVMRPEFVMAEGEGFIGTGKNLIVVNFMGGSDGASLFPFLGSPGSIILSRRPTLGVPLNQVLVASPNVIGFHPNWGTGVTVPPGTTYSVYNEFQSNKVKMLLGIGTEEFISGSHNIAKAVYSTGGRYESSNQAKGWFASIVEQFNYGQYQAFGFNTSLGRDLQTAELGRITVADDISTLQQLNRISTLGGPTESSYTRRIAKQLSDIQASKQGLDKKVGRALAGMQQLVADFTPIRNHPLTCEAYYPNSKFGAAVKSAAKVISYFKANESPRKNRLFYLTRPGFDSHKDQINNLNGGINDASQALGALIGDLRLTGTYNDTLIIVISEFGRKISTNGGTGTDHGWGNNLMAIGGRVRGGIVGDPPTVDEATNNIMFGVSTAFQNLIVEAVDWLGHDARPLMSSYTSRNLQLML